MRKFLEDHILKIIFVFSILIAIIMVYILSSRVSAYMEFNKSGVALKSNEEESNIKNDEKEYTDDNIYDEYEKIIIDSDNDSKEQNNEDSQNDNEENIEYIIEEQSANRQSGTQASHGSTYGYGSGGSTRVVMTQSESGDNYSVVGTIIIDKINVNLQILSKFTDELMRISVCRLWGPDYPNQVGNFCIVGHNYRNTKFFSKLPNLEVGDTFKIVDINQNTVNYRIYDKYTVEPTDVSSLNQNTNGKRIVTLITCTNDSRQRYIFKAEAI